MFVKIFTDGAARGNPEGPGGYGTVLQYIDSKGELHEREYSAGYKKTTNNRMELMAVITGLEALTRPCEVEVISDSKYVTDAFNQHWVDGWLKRNWKGSNNNPVKNVDLWKRLLKAKAPHQVKFTWVIRKMNVVTNWLPQQQMAIHFLTMLYRKCYDYIINIQ